MLLIHRFMSVKQLFLNCSSTINTNKHKWAQPSNLPTFRFNFKYSVYILMKCYSKDKTRKLTLSSSTWIQ